MRCFAHIVVVCVGFASIVDAQEDSCATDWKNMAFWAPGTTFRYALETAECRQMCNDDPNCDIFTYQWSTKACSLFELKYANTAFYQVNTISGPKRCCECGSADCCCCKPLFEMVISPCIQNKKVWVMLDADIVQSKSFHHCVQLCWEDTTLPCTGASYDTGTGKCYKTFMQSTDMGAEPAVDFLAVERDCCIHPSTNFTGDSYKTVEAQSVHDCQTICLLDDDCLGFNYNEETKMCSNVYEWIKMENLLPYNPKYKTGLRQCCDQKGAEHMYPIDTVNDIHDILECRHKCQEHLECGYVSHYKQEGRCDLFYPSSGGLRLASNISDVTSGPRHCLTEYINYTTPFVKTYTHTEIECEILCAKSEFENIDCNIWTYYAEECVLREKAGKRIRGRAITYQYHKSL